MDRDNVVDNQQQNYALDADEIDLVELFQCLWQQKLLIIVCTAVITTIAAAYAFLSPPVYETKAGVLPPQLSDIAAYNVGSNTVGLTRFSVTDIYTIFERNLLSEGLKYTFFREIYLPALAEDKRAGAKDKLWDEFNQMLTVKAPDKKNRPDLYEVMIEYESPELVAEWVNRYINMAAQKTEQDMQKNVHNEIAFKRKTIERQIEVLRITEKKHREDRIARLQEALMVAEAVGYDDPQVVAGKTPSNGVLADFVDGNLMYMRGAKAIRAELTALEERENDDPFINGLRDLEKQLSLLKRIEINWDDASVFTADSSPEVPETPVKPRKAIILALGLIAGVMLGVFAALIHSMLKKRQVQVG